MRCSVLREGLLGAAVPKARAHHPRVTGSPAQVVVGAQGGLVGATVPKARAHQLEGTGSLA